MREIVLQVPDDPLLVLTIVPGEIGKGSAATVKLFELGRLSSGAAARLAGIPRTLFLIGLANYGLDTFTWHKISRQGLFLTEVICNGLGERGRRLCRDSTSLSSWLVQLVGRPLLLGIDMWLIKKTQIYSCS